MEKDIFPDTNKAHRSTFEDHPRRQRRSRPWCGGLWHPRFRDAMSTFGALLAGHRDEHHDVFLAAMDVDRVVELLSFLGSWKQQSEPDVKENSYHIEVGFFYDRGPKQRQAQRAMAWLTEFSMTANSLTVFWIMKTKTKFMLNFMTADSLSVFWIMKAKIKTLKFVVVGCWFEVITAMMLKLFSFLDKFTKKKVTSPIDAIYKKL